MNVDFDPSAALGFLRGIVRELREKRLWPFAVALLVAIVAVPVLLSKSSSRPPVAQASAPLPPSAAISLPAVSVQSAPAPSRLRGTGHDPFAQHTGKKSVTASATASGATGASGSSTPAARTTATTSGTLPPTTTTPTSITPNAKPTATTTALSATQSYHVTLAITNASGGLATVDPLERLSVLPSSQQPLLVELGVLNGGHRVLFVVQPGTVVNGPGTCTPGPVDCEILSLAQDQTEGISVQSPTGPVSIALFAVTGITTDRNSSATAADKARRTESAAGRALLDHSTLSALSLFRYEPSLGAVADLRNLTVGGS